jgi:dolichyl-phosphate-mannose--protein O-mannosyl transferase
VWLHCLFSLVLLGPIYWLEGEASSLSLNVCRLDPHVKIFLIYSTVVRNRFWNSTGFFFIAWAFHYFPFFLMNRQLFLHHYLPAHLCSALVAGSVFNFIAGESINYPVSNPGPGMRRMPSARSDVGTRALIAFGLYMIPLLAMFVFLAPLTYGTPGYVFFPLFKRPH